MGMRVQLRDDASADVQLLDGEVATSATDESLLSLQAGLAAGIAVGSPDGRSGRLEIRPIKVTTSNLLQKGHVEDDRGGVLERSFIGYRGSDQPDRVSTDFAWALLAGAIPQRFERRPATDDDRRLLVEAWGQARLPWFAEAPMAALAGVAGSRDLLPALVPLLDSERPQVQALAVDAIAAITGWDARKGSDGGSRLLEDVVRDYRNECRLHAAAPGGKTPAPPLR